MTGLNGPTGPYYTTKNIFGNDNIYSPNGDLVGVVDHNGLFGDIIIGKDGDTKGFITDNPLFEDSKEIFFEDSSSSFDSFM